MPSYDTPKTVRLSGHDEQHEAIGLTAVITPGMLVERAAGGVRRHSTAGGGAIPSVAVEDRQIGGGIDDDYAVGSQVTFGVFSLGSHVYALLASGQNVAEGIQLVSDGAGSLKIAAPAVGAYDQVVARSLEAVNNTGGTTPRIRVELVSELSPIGT